MVAYPPPPSPDLHPSIPLLFCPSTRPPVCLPSQPQMVVSTTPPPETFAGFSPRLLPHTTPTHRGCETHHLVNVATVMPPVLTPLLPLATQPPSSQPSPSAWLTCWLLLLLNTVIVILHNDLTQPMHLACPVYNIVTFGNCQ